MSRKRRSGRFGGQRITQRIQRSLHPRLDLAKFQVRNLTATVTTGGSMSGQVIIQNMYQQPTSGSGSSIVAGADKIYYFVFSITDIGTSINTYANLWDECKLAGIRFMAIPRIKSSMDSATGNNITENWCLICSDYDGQGPGSLQQMRNFNACKEITDTCKKPIRKYIKPKTLVQMTDLQSHTTNSIVGSRWIYNFGTVNGNSALQHYGIVVGVPGTSPIFADTGGAQSITGTGNVIAQCQTWDLECTYYVAFRSRIG